MKIELHNSDCVAGMHSLPSESVDIVVTSPPYNLGIAYSKFKDTASRVDYLNWSREWITEIKRVLSPNGSLFLNVGGSLQDPWLPYELALTTRDFLTLQNTIHWIKSITVNMKDGEVSTGHFKPINSERYLNDCHEYVFHFTKTGSVKLDRLAVGVAYADKSNVARWGHTEGKDKRCRGNNWFIPYETITNRDKDRPHPATFPVQLVEWCIRLHGLNSDLVVLDPFLGIGSSAVAARNCGVGRFVGYEIDSTYLLTAQERLKQ